MTSTVSNTPGLRMLQATEAKAQIPLIYNPTTGDYDLATSSDGLLNVATYVWNTGTLSWDKAVQAGGGGGGGGPATIADGADVAEGATTDAAVITDVAGTLSGKLRGLIKWAFERMPVSLGQKVMADSLPVVIASDQSSLIVIGTGVGGSIPINDNGGSITVDGIVTITTGAFPVEVTVAPPLLTPEAPTNVSVGVASASAVATSPSRKGLVLTNRSTATISIAFNNPAVLNSGITLTPDGVFVMDGFTSCPDEVFAIASAAASTLTIQQFV